MWYGVWYELCAFLGFRIVVDYVKNSCWLHNLRARPNWNSRLMNFNLFTYSTKNLWNFSVDENSRHQHPSPTSMLSLSTSDPISILYPEKEMTQLVLRKLCILQYELLYSWTVLWKTKRNYPSLILTDKKYFHQNISKYKKKLTWLLEYVGKTFERHRNRKIKILSPFLSTLICVSEIKVLKSGPRLFYYCKNHNYALKFTFITLKYPWNAMVWRHKYAMMTS